MPIDASIYNKLNAAPSDPLKTVGDAVGIANSLQQNKLLQTGNKSAEVGLDKDKAALAMQKYKNLAERILPMAGDPDLSHKKIIDGVVQAIADGTVSPDEGNNFLGSLGEDNPQHNRAIMQSLGMRLLDANAKMEQMFGKQIQTQAGGDIYSGVQKPASQGGGVNYQSTTPITTTPAEKMARDAAIINGKPTTIPRGEIYDNLGNLKGSGAPNTGARPEGWNSQDDPGQEAIATGSNIMPPELPSSGNAPYKGALQTELTPPEKAEQANTGEQSVVLQRSADSSPDRKAILGTMEGLIKSGDFNSGPGAEKWKDVTAGMQRVFGIKSNSVASQEEFNKLSERLLQEQFKTIGGTGTDAKFGSAMRTSPSTALSNLGNEGIIALMKGNEDAINIKNKEWRDYSKEVAKQGGVPNYADFSSQFNEVFDPRVFQAKHMTPEARKKLITALSPEEKKKYRQDYNIADDNGWLK